MEAMPHQSHINATSESAGLRISKAFSQSQRIPKGFTKWVPFSVRGQSWPPTTVREKRPQTGVRLVCSALGEQAGGHLSEVLVRRSSLKEQPPSPEHFLPFGGGSECVPKGNGRVNMEESKSPLWDSGQSSRPGCGWPLCMAFGKTFYCSETQFLYL